MSKQKASWCPYVKALTFLILTAFGIFGTAMVERQRRWARRANDMGNVKSIILALQLYASENCGFFPNELAELHQSGCLTAGRTYVSPGSRSMPPTDAREIREGKCDYLYLGAGTRDLRCSQPAASVPILMTAPGLLAGGYVSIGYADGRVETHRRVPDDVAEALRERGLE